MAYAMAIRNYCYQNTYSWNKFLKIIQTFAAQRGLNPRSVKRSA